MNIPPGIQIGFDLDLDRERGFTISSDGVVVIAKGDGVEELEPSEQLALDSV